MIQKIVRVKVTVFDFDTYNIMIALQRFFLKFKLSVPSKP